MRIGGIASGIDTEQIIKDLMRAERTRVDRFFQQEQRIRWKQEAYLDVNRNIANFILNTRKDFGLNNVSHTGAIRRSSVDNFNWIKKAVSSNQSVAAVSARANAINGAHTLEVTQLALNASASSKNLVTEGILIDGKFTAGGTITVTTDIGSADITVAAGDTISSFITKLNNAVTSGGANIGLQAAYDSGLGRMMIVTRETGQAKSIRVTNAGGGTIAERLFEGDIISATGVRGRDARVLFNGSELLNPTNNFTVFGIELRLNQLGTTQINVSSNTDGIYDKIKSFVDKYNEIISQISNRLGEKFHRNFPPLTEEQKGAMSERDIELWEEKSKSGLIRNDESLSRMLQSLRNSLYDQIEGSFNHISQLGITTGNYKDGGRLVIDEQKLRDAINADTEGVINMFFRIPEEGTANENKNIGLVQRVYNEMVNGMREVISRSGTGNDAGLFRSIQGNMLIDFVIRHGSVSMLDRDLSSINRSILREEEILLRRENHYWNKFAAMEKAMSRMNQQGSWLMSQLGMAQQ